jgi:hypothetical protein
MCYAIIGQYTSFSSSSDVDAPTSIDIWVFNRRSNEKRLGGGIELWTFELNEEVQRYLCITRRRCSPPTSSKTGDRAWKPT